MEAKNDAHLPQSPLGHVHTFCFLVINTRPWITRVSSLTSPSQVGLPLRGVHGDGYIVWWCVTLWVSNSIFHVVCSMTRLLFSFFMPHVFFFPAHLLSSPFYSFSPLVVTQIRGHTAGYSPSLPTAVRTLHFYRENLWVLLSSTRVEFTLSYKSCLYIIMSWVGEASDRYSRRMNSIICTTYILQLIPYQVLRCAVLHNNEKRQMWDRGFRRNSCSFASFVGFYDRAYVRVLCDLIKTVKSSLRGKDALLGESGKTIYFS